MKQKLFIAFISALAYWLIKTYVPYGVFLVYPINLFVTFLHEFGHSFFAVITGGRVDALQINFNGSGYAVISGGFMPLVLMGGYIGSAIFGNILLHIGLYKPKTTVVTLYVLMFALVLSAVWLYNSIFTSLLLIAFAAAFYFLRKKSKESIAYILIVIGTASIMYIVEDYRVGPSSDLAKFTEILPILPQFIWGIIWLGLALWLTWFNLKPAMKSIKK